LPPELSGTLKRMIVTVKELVTEQLRMIIPKKDVKNTHGK